MPESISYPNTFYRCSECGSIDVQLSYPVWVPANDIDNYERYDQDFEAQPEKDSDLTWCPVCEEHTGVDRVEGELPTHDESCDMDQKCNCKLVAEREAYMKAKRADEFFDPAEDV